MRDISRDEAEKRRKIGKMYLHNKFEYIFFLAANKSRWIRCGTVKSFSCECICKFACFFFFCRTKVINNKHQNRFGICLKSAHYQIRRFGKDLRAALCIKIQAKRREIMSFKFEASMIWIDGMRIFTRIRWMCDQFKLLNWYRRATAAANVCRAQKYKTNERTQKRGTTV